MLVKKLFNDLKTVRHLNSISHKGKPEELTIFGSIEGGSLPQVNLLQLLNNKQVLRN